MNFHQPWFCVHVRDDVGTGTHRRDVTVRLACRVQGIKQVPWGLCRGENWNSREFVMNSIRQPVYSLKTCMDAVRFPFTVHTSLGAVF